MKGKFLVYLLGAFLLLSGLTTTVYAATGTLNSTYDTLDSDLPAYFYEEPEKSHQDLLAEYEEYDDDDDIEPHQEKYDVYVDNIYPLHITAIAGGPYQNQTGRKINFAGMAWPGSKDGGYLVSYRWEFGDGASYVGYFPRPIKSKDGYIAVEYIEIKYPVLGFRCSANHTYIHDGYYVATLTVYDSKGDSSSDSALVAIKRPVPDVNYPSWPSNWWSMAQSSESSFSKKVRDPQCSNWVETADYHAGEEIQFKLSFKVPTDKSNVRDVKIVDYLPPTVRYVSATPSPSKVEKVVYFDRNSISFHPFTVLTWNIGKPSGSTATVTIVGNVERLSHDEFGISQYDYIPIAYTTKNTAICGYKYTAYASGCGNPYTRTVTLKNTATFNIIAGQPHIKIVKQVSVDPSDLWYNDEATVNVGDTVKFKLIVGNDGNVAILKPIWIKDLLPDGLEYVIGSSSYSLFHGNSITFPIPKEPIIDNNLLIWRFNESLDVGSGIMVTFKAVAEKAGTYINLGTVIARYGRIPLYDDDMAIVIVKKSDEPKINVEKKVWDGDGWTDCTSAAIGNNVKFKIIVSNEGNIDLTNVIINDTFPEFLKYADPTPLLDNNYVEWHIPVLGINETTEIIFNTTASQVGSGLNKVKVTCDQSVEDEDEVCVIVSSYSLDVKKEVSLDDQTWDKNVKAYTGDKVYYRIHVKNDGTADLHNITIKDSILWLTFLNFNKSQPEPDYINNGYIYWNISLLKSGEEYYIYYTVDTLSPGEACNLVYGKAEEDAEDSDCSHIKVVTKPITRVYVEKYASIDGTDWSKKVSVETGDTVYFQILIKNNGTTKLDVLEVNDTIPDYLEFVEQSFIPINADVDEKTVIWILEDIEAGATAELYFNATAVSCGEGCNFVEVYATNGSDHSYDSDTASVNVICPDIDVEKQVSIDNLTWVESVTVHPGDKVYWKIVVTNTGNCDLYNVWVNDSGNDVNVGTLVPSGTYTIYWNDTYDADFTNTANARGVDSLGFEVTDTDTATVDVISSGISVTKTPDITEGHAGDVVNYTIVVTNTGDDTLYDVYVNDTTLGISYYISSLAAGESKTYYVEHTLASEPDPFENCVEAEGYDALGERYSDSDCATVDIIPEELNITVEKTVKWDCTPPFEKELYITPEEWEQANWVTFKIDVNNTGETPLDIVVKDRLPDGLTYADHATPFEYNYTDGTYYYWNFTNVPSGGNITIMFRAYVEDCGDYNNTVEVIGSYEDYEVHDEDYAVVHVPCECEPGISVDKRIWDENTDSWVNNLLVDGYPVNVLFNITIENTGTCDLINITVEDTLDCGLGGARNFTVTPDDAGAGYATWSFDGPLAPSEKIFIEFEATALINTANHVTVEAESSDDGTPVSSSDTVNITLSEGAPVLSFSPSSYDFGDMMVGESGSTTFEIWNSGSGQLNYTLSESCDWVSVSPLSGNSSGEHDTITVSVDTTGLSEDLYICNISISSNGGSGTFTVTVNVTGEQPPVLSFSPSSYDFGDMMVGESGSTTFEIWNSGSGQLNYTLSESCDWVSVSPLSGNSSGEHDTITVSVDTTGLSEGTLYTCEIFISSNDGTGIFTVQLYVMEQQPIPPTVEIVKPEKNKLYFKDKPIIRILRTFIIGPVTIQANATDADGYIWKVDFFIDDTLKYTDYSAPYSWLWNETAFGKHTIKVRAYDNDGLTAEEKLNVTIFNFGFGSVEEKGVVKGKVTEAGKMIKRGIPGVLVTASDGTNTTTGKIPVINRGKYSLQLTPGIYDITFEADGYVPYTEENVEVTSGDTVNLDVQLEPACEGCE